MKLKTVFLAGLVAAAGAITVSAADVFSVNAVGFVNVTVTNGTFRIITNPLNQGGNTLAEILPNAPVGTKIFKFNYIGQNYSAYTMRPGTPNFWGGGGATAVFNPGEGFFVQAPAGDPLAVITLTFVGEVAQGAALTINIPTGFSMVAAHVPQSASLETELGLAAKNGDKVFFFRNGSYATASRRTSTWSGSGALDVNGQPRPEVGEGFFFLNANTATTWTRNFSANN